MTLHLSEIRDEPRLLALRRYEILDTAPEPTFDEIAALASEICATPIAFVMFVDKARVWCKARTGMELTELPRDLAFCDTTIQQRGVAVIPDLTADDRYSRNPLVIGETAFRFYAGAPLVTHDGFPIGTLCVLDRKPRELSELQRKALAILGEQVMAQVELRQRLSSALSLSEELESRVRERTSALSEENARRRKAENELRGLSLNLLRVQEAERTRLARQVHDDLGQQLTALSIYIGRLRNTCGSSQECLQMLGSMQQIVDDTTERVRQIARDLRPAVLDDLGLVPAFHGELQRFQERTGITTALRAAEGLDGISHDRSTALFRILQEGLTNVVRHAQATHVEVALTAEDSSLVMTVRDNGIGIDPDATHRSTSLGVIGVRERTRQLGGTMSLLRCSESGGTLLRVCLPT